MNLIGYVRVSTEKQAKQGESLEEQRVRIEAYCVAGGHRLVAAFADEGISGTVDPEDRPGLHQALMACREKAWDADGLIALDLSRVSRDLGHLLALFKGSARHKFDVVLVKDGIDTSTAAGRLLLHIMGSVNQFVRDNIAERTSMALQHRLTTGRSIGPCVPLGLKRATGPNGERLLVPSMKERNVLRFFVARLKEGKKGRAITNALAREGVVHPRSGKTWTYNAVKSVLRHATLEDLERRLRFRRQGVDEPEETLTPEAAVVA
jgi:site-specific DNA recombinase